MSRFRNFYIITLASLPLAVLAFIWQPLAVIYSLIFFTINVALIFEVTEVPFIPEYSSLNFYERAARWNWMNYALAAFIVFSSMAIVIVPLPLQVTTAVIWLLEYALLRMFLKRALKKLNEELLATYLQQQLADIPPAALTEYSQLVMNNKHIAADAFRSKHSLVSRQYISLEHYARRYIESNLLSRL